MKTLNPYLLTVENVFNAIGLITRSTTLMLKKGVVVNQEKLPDSIPQVVFWLLPTVVLTPLIFFG